MSLNGPPPLDLERTYATENLLMGAAVDGKVICFSCQKKYDVNVVKKAGLKHEGSMYVPISMASKALLCYTCVPLWGSDKSKSNPSDFGRMIRRWMPTHWAIHGEWRCCDPYRNAGCEGRIEGSPREWQQYDHRTKKGVICSKCRKHRDTLRKNALGCTVLKQRLGVHMHNKYIDSIKMEDAILAFLKDGKVTHPRDVLNKDGAAHYAEVKGADKDASTTTTTPYKRPKKAATPARKRAPPKASASPQQKAVKRKVPPRDEAEAAPVTATAQEKAAQPAKKKKRVSWSEKQMPQGDTDDSSSSSSESESESESESSPSSSSSESAGSAKVASPRSEDSDEPLAQATADNEPAAKEPLFTSAVLLKEGEELVEMVILAGDKDISAKLDELRALITAKTKERDDALKAANKPALSTVTTVELRYYEGALENSTV